MENSPLLLKINETATLMGVSRWTINAMCRRFELKFIPISRRRKLIPRAEVERWIREHTVSSNEALKKALDRRRIA